MYTADMNFKVCCDRNSEPPMYGIMCQDGTCVHQISTDYQEVVRLAEQCRLGEVSSCHLADVAHDFCLSG